MGGIFLRDIGSKIAGDFIEGFGGFLTKDTGGYGFVRSTEALLSKTESGKILKDYLAGTVEPKARQFGQQLLDQKIASGVSKEVAAKDAVKEGWQQARKTYLGQKDEVLIKAIHNATKQGGVIHGNAIADAMSIYFNDASSYWRTAKIRTSPMSTPIQLTKVGIRANARFNPADEIEGKLRRSLSWMYTPLIAIPHTAQVGNIILDNVNTPIKSIARGLGEYFSTGVTKDKFQADLIRSGALFDEIRYHIMEDAKSGGKAGIFYKMFNHPGFGFVRRQEIALAAAIGKHAALEAADRLGAGSATKSYADTQWARHALQKLGLDVNKIAEQGFKLSQDDIEKAMYNEANRTIFFRDQLKTPWRWKESFSARVGTQYRHFQYRQTKFLSQVFQDAYKERGSLGLAKAIGTFATLFPVFGELVHSIENLTEGKNPLERDSTKQFGGNEYTDALAHAAGFGVFYSIARAGMWNGGRGFLEGPLLTTAEDILIGIPSDVSKGNFLNATRRVVSKLGAPGKAADVAIKEYQESNKEPKEKD